MPPPEKFLPKLVDGGLIVNGVKDLLLGYMEKGFKKIL